MAAIKVSIPMQKQILELHSKGFTARKIAKTLKVGRNTIKRILARGEIAMPGGIAPEWAKTIDWEKVRLEKGFTFPLIKYIHNYGLFSVGLF